MRRFQCTRNPKRWPDWWPALFWYAAFAGCAAFWFAVGYGIIILLRP